MSQGSNRISNSIEMNAAVVELLEDVMKENDGKEGKEKCEFFRRKQKTLVKEIADFPEIQGFTEKQKHGGGIPK